MAISINNIITNGLSGKLGQFIFRRWYGKTVMVTKAAVYNRGSAAQLQNQNLFRQAHFYAKRVLSNPSLLQFYTDRVQGAQRAYNLAVSDYLSAPVIHQVNTDNYIGKAVSSITCQVTDNFKVAEVEVVIKKDGGLVEWGHAFGEADGIHWTYTATKEINPVDVVVIEVQAKDISGRMSSLSYMHNFARSWKNA